MSRFNPSEATCGAFWGWTAFVLPAMLISRIMYGRYSAVGTLDEFEKMIGFNLRVPFFAPRYNIAPRQQAPVLLLENRA